MCCGSISEMIEWLLANPHPPLFGMAERNLHLNKRRHGFRSKANDIKVRTGFFSMCVFRKAEFSRQNKKPVMKSLWICA